MSPLIKRRSLSENTSTTSTTTNSSNLSETSRLSSNPSELSVNPVRHLYLVRHGQYERQQTIADGNLTIKGQKQAWYAANFLISQLPENVLFDSLTHSDTIRTRETATIIYKQLKLMKKIDIEYFSIDTDFREHNYLCKFLIEGNWRSLKRDYFHLKKSFIENCRTTFEIIIAHRNIIGHCIELLTNIQPDKSIAFNTSITHIIVDQTRVLVDYAYKHDFLPIELLTMWETFPSIKQNRLYDDDHVHIHVKGVRGMQRKGCCFPLFVSCLK